MENVSAVWISNFFAVLIRNCFGLGVRNEERIERSRPTWTQVKDSEANSSASNLEVVEKLQEDSSWGGFFHTFREGKLKMSRKIAEGGQAEIYEAQIIRRNPRWDKDIQWVLKVFEENDCLEDSQVQWPNGMLQHYSERVLKHHSERAGDGELIPRYNCDVQCGTLLKDGRFAFLMQREHTDLRTLIDEAMELRTDQNSGPFSAERAGSIMQQIAQGMLWLHNKGIIHRDLKAANVLVRVDDGEYLCFVTDYECSVRVVGTRFWRTPEVLQAVKDKKVFQNPKLFTRAVDIYSYGMMCYEILTMVDPKGAKVYVDVDAWAHELVRRCWECNPGDRHSCEEILNLISASIRGDATKRQRVSWAQLATIVSKTHWSSLTCSRDSIEAVDEVAKFDDEEVFKTLQMHPTWGQFFRTFGYGFGISESSDELEVGEKFAEGGQAELYHVQVKWRNPELNEEDLKEGCEWVLKVFKKGTLLRHLQLDLHRFLQWCAEDLEPTKTGTCKASIWEKPK